ncbi:MAG TPA: dihydrofolate reductase family protein [Acidimicrobiales bacterium]|jgi:dihydrofolate reductase|nr:dihydrofolate reductase family protein [Acidimicrobiales bacterium]
MSRIVVTEFVSLDGVMEDPGGAEGTTYGGWTFKFERGPEGGKFKFDELMAADALLLGRVTYQAFAAAWPGMGGDEFGDKMNRAPKYVVSSTLSDSEATWGDTTVLRGDVVAEIAKLKAGPGGDLLVAGSSQLVHTLTQNGLVDEYRLMVFPIILGSGKRVFPDAEVVSELTLTTQAEENGVLLLTYRPA